MALYDIVRLEPATCAICGCIETEGNRLRGFNVCQLSSDHPLAGKLNCFLCFTEWYDGGHTDPDEIRAVRHRAMLSESSRRAAAQEPAK